MATHKTELSKIWLPVYYQNTTIANVLATQKWDAKKSEYARQREYLVSTWLVNILCGLIIGPYLLLGLYTVLVVGPDLPLYKY